MKKKFLPKNTSTKPITKRLESDRSVNLIYILARYGTFETTATIGMLFTLATFDQLATWLIIQPRWNARNIGRPLVSPARYLNEVIVQWRNIG